MFTQRRIDEKIKKIKSKQKKPLTSEQKKRINKSWKVDNIRAVAANFMRNEQFS